MATRNGQSYFWSTIEDLFDQDIPNRESLFKRGIHRLHDSIVAGRDLVFNLAQQLGSTNAGTSAVQRGTVVMGTLAFYDPIDTPVGDLDGKTIIIQTDLAGPVTITFAQPTSPAHAATQANTQGSALGVVFSVDTGVDPNTGGVVSANVGKLLLVRPSGGAASLTVKGAGTANAILGLPLIDTAVSGAGTVNDGASRIGSSAVGAIPAGTLRSILVAIETVTANALLKTGGVVTGSVSFSGSTARKRIRPVRILPNTSTAIGPTADVMVVPIFAGASITYTINTSSLPTMEEGDEITIISLGNNPGDSIIIAQEGPQTMLTISGGNYAFVVIGYDAVGDGDPCAYVKSFGTAGGTITMSNPYPLP